MAKDTGVKTYTRSVATMSWIDPDKAQWQRASKARPPEFDKKGEPPTEVRRDTVLGKQLYRFANFLETYVKVIPTRGDTWIGDYGFTSRSDIYRGLSFAGIPSQAFQVKQFVEQSDANSISFRQIVGARTQSPEVIAGHFGKIAEEIVEFVLSFPPIWTDVRLTMFRDGYYEAEVLRHSLFPSMSFYEGHTFSLDTPGTVLVPVLRSSIRARKDGDGRIVHESGKGVLAMPVKAVEDGLYRRISTYNAVPNYMEWRRRGWGALEDKGKHGPVGGSPWAIKPGGGGVDRGLGSLDQVYDSSGREVSPKETRL